MAILAGFPRSLLWYRFPMVSDGDPSGGARDQRTGAVEAGNVARGSQEQTARRGPPSESLRRSTKPPPFKSDSLSREVVSAPELTRQHLDALFNREICVLRVSEFCAPELASRMADWLLAHARVEQYGHEELKQDGTLEYLYYGVDRVGVPFNKTLGPNGEAFCETYYREALPGIRRLRASIGCDLTPVDRLRLELDEIWPNGANVAAFEGRKMFVGIARIMQAERSKPSEQFPHFDGVLPNIFPFDGQFGANIYLRVPDEGGELQVWGAPPENEEIVRSKLGEPTRIKPSRGDLVLFDAGRVHAIGAFTKGVRVGLHCFVGYKKDHPIQLWN